MSSLINSAMSGLSAAQSALNTVSNNFKLQRGRLYPPDHHFGGIKQHPDRWWLGG
ncbi:flagellar basal body protein [Enterobacter hormaechei]